ncbi:MAG: flagellar hook-associated protein FlgK [Azoarcus sp.]|jgi:flagellar hook-associated protein 1 FlgK|nr:flagellar hook-associated protein FlgK [Azoarcus sp.]
MAGLLNIGLTGVNAALGQLVTTGHNIANVDTAGYHRQQVTQASQMPYFSGVGFFGNGTKITSVTRAYDQFLENQVLSAGTHKSQYATYSAQISQIDNLLADVTAGLSPVLDEFFAGVQEVAANPTNTPARQALISSAQALVGRFHSLDTRLQEIRDGVEYDIRATVEQINTYTSAIAELNQRIVVAQAAGPGKPVNDLLDQRWQLVSELNDLIQVTTKVQSDGTMSIYFGSGQSLVQGNQATRLGVIAGDPDPRSYDVATMPALAGGTPTRLPERLMTGGQLAGLLEFRRESLDTTQNRLGMIAVSIASAFNNQHELGVDLEGALGQEFFHLSMPEVIPTGAATVTFDFNTDPLSDDIGNLGLLSDADYRLEFDGTNYRVINLSSGADSGWQPASVIDFEGLSVDVSASSLTANQSALIQPTRNMARDISLALFDPRQVAAGCPVISNVPTTNTGNGTIADIVMSDVTGAAVPPAPAWDASLTYSTGTLTVGGGFTPATLAFDPATESAGKTFTLTGPGGFEFTFTFSGTPQNGDTFDIVPTDKGVADSRNANLLGALQTRKILFASNGEGTTTINSAYSQLVNKVGNKAHEVQTNELMQMTLYAQAAEARDALSAVNLDEEAANLIRYQQAYQASGQVMSIAQRLFDEIINIVR